MEESTLGAGEVDAKQDLFDLDFLLLYNYLLLQLESQLHWSLRAAINIPQFDLLYLHFEKISQSIHCDRKKLILFCDYEKDWIKQGLVIDAESRGRF